MLLGILRITTELLTGHCYLEGHLFELGLVDSPDAHTNLKLPRMFFVTVTHRQY
jgi:hypothetical protein